MDTALRSFWELNCLDIRKSKNRFSKSKSSNCNFLNCSNSKNCFVKYVCQVIRDNFSYPFIFYSLLFHLNSCSYSNGYPSTIRFCGTPPICRSGSQAICSKFFANWGKLYRRKGELPPNYLDLENEDARDGACEWHFSGVCEWALPTGEYSLLKWLLRIGNLLGFQAVRDAC